MHRNSSLATALSRYFEAKSQRAPQSSKRPIATVEDINSTLTAIEDQTSNFNWKGLALAVAAKLGLEDYATKAPLSLVVFEGLLSTLPSLQYFPEEHVLHISTGADACAVVIWAHTILGLNVAVHYADKSKDEIIFGSPASINLFVNVGLNLFHEESMTLVACKSGEKVIELESEEDKEYLDAAQLHPLRGYATNAMSKTIPRTAPGAEKVLGELLHVATAFAICASKHIYNIGSPSDGRAGSVPVSYKQKSCQ